MKPESYDIMLDEINSASNPIEKEMLLQKYGMIPPKLTPFEKSIVTRKAIVYYRIKEL